MLHTDTTMKVLPVLGLCATFGCVFAGPINQAIGIEIQSRDVPPAVCSGYKTSCTLKSTFIFVKDKSVLLVGADCDSGTGVSSSTTLDLNQCIRNSGGTMHGGNNGGFGGTCSNFQLDQDSTVLTADCGDGKGNQVKSTLELDSIIGNSGGGFCCYGHGPTTKDCPHCIPF
ncbi:hypothetical protein F5Y10DRAFT_146318 [Nemania abortiva]|nr:hypothetical protein F5Y10DRAFT_146318 [Nemania abortiva]